jgi:hypothetical protein
MEGFIAKHRLVTRPAMSYKGGTKWQMDCLFNPAHQAPDAMLCVTASGAAAYQCQHNSCQGKDWHAVRDLLEPGWRDAKRGEYRGTQERTTRKRRVQKEEVVGEESTEGLPFIECNRRFLRDKSDDAVKALLKANDPPSVFVRSGRMVRIGTDEQARPFIEPLNTPSLRGILARCASFVSTSDDRGVVPVAPPKEVVEDILSLAGWPDIPSLSGIVTAPVVATNGSLVFKPGYLADAGVYYHERHGAKIGDTEPTSENVEKAKKLIMETILGDFPFVDESSRAHSLALLFLPFVRALVDGPTPFHLISAPTPGSGKSLLAKALTAAFIYGGASEQPAPGHDDEEWRKRITSSLMGGGSHVWLDNIAKKMDCGQFALAITASEWRDRMLGGNVEVTMPVRCVWLGTGNNTVLSDEITRRTVEIRLDSEQERPWDRDSGQFKITNLGEWVKEERGQYLTATLTLLRKWIDDGRPRWTGKPLGSFESWSRIMGGILDSIGVVGFLANRDDLYERLDPEREKWCLFFRQWHKQHGEKLTGTADVIAIAVECEIVAEDTKGNRVLLGRQLQKQCDRVYAGLRLIRGKVKDKSSQYSITTVSTKPRFSKEKTGDTGDTGDNTLPHEEVSNCKPIDNKETIQSMGDSSPVSPVSPSLDFSSTPTANDDPWDIDDLEDPFGDLEEDVIE